MSNEQKERKVPNKNDLKKKRERQQWILIISFLLVPLILLIVFTYLPLLDMVKYSFCKWNGISKDMKFIGFKNYIEFFSKKKYWSVLLTSLYYLIGSVLQIVIALFFATILNYDLKCKNFFKGIIFFPYLINGVAIGFIFLHFYKTGGTLDTVLTSLGIPQGMLPLWLGNASIINISLVFVSLWRYLGQNMVMFNGAIQSVNTELLQAASLDGANKWQQFRFITFPSIKMIVGLNLILAVKGAISVFEIPYIMTTGANGSGTFITQTLDMAFTNKRVGMASAMGVILLILIMIITFIQKHFFEGGENND